MMLNVARIGVIAILIGFGVTGCIDHKVLPSPLLTVDPEFLPVLDISHSVAIIGEPVIMDEEMLVCDLAPHRYYATSEDLTNTAVAVLKDVFSKNDIKISQNGKKKLKLSITRTTCEPGAFTVTYIAKLNVVAGDNIKKKFQGIKVGAHIVGAATWTIEKAVINSVLEMLKDPEIMKYLGHK